MEHIFEVTQFSRRSEIEVLKTDEKKMIIGFNELEVTYNIIDFSWEKLNNLVFKAGRRLNRSEIMFLRGRIMPKRSLYTPKVKKVIKYDKSIVVGITPDMRLIYKQIN